MKYTIEPIAFVKNSRKEILDDNWGNVISTIELADDIKETAVDGIEEFSHLEIIYYFHKVADEKNNMTPGIRATTLPFQR
ncbi:hypothetical protein GCM10010978_29980 [Compostibacillus humi]|uniref:TsaA-like domain-containing protein n=1 Tax=Compostibacillus humi TaxID=1245525 RepID=A0A8J2TRN0_9BACI|nr:hypothetical protein GCM10010978_29980 [Compostibacillus humi]